LKNNAARVPIIGTRAVRFGSLCSGLRGVQHLAIFNFPRCSTFRGVAATRAANSPILKYFVGLLGNFLLIRVGLGLGAHGCVARLAEC
jgi:hypothetical protein